MLTFSIKSLKMFILLMFFFLQHNYQIIMVKIFSGMMGNTVAFRVPIMHDGKYSQISCSYNA
jgi:hypothetical protein